MRHARNSFGLLHLEKTTSSVISVLLLSYAYHEVDPLNFDPDPQKYEDPRIQRAKYQPNTANKGFTQNPNLNY